MTLEFCQVWYNEIRPMKQSHDISKNIRRARLASGLSQQELASRLEVSDKTISAYETGRATPPVSTLANISTITNTSMSSLMGIKTEIKPLRELGFNENIVNLFIQLGILKEIERTGWVLKGIRTPESVADHNLRTTLIAMILGNRYKEIDKHKLLEMSLIHDLGTIKLGDVVTEHGLEVVGNKKSRRDEEKNVIQDLLKPLGKEANKYIKLWEEYAEQKTMEARFLKQVEKLEMSIQALEYEISDRSTQNLNDFWLNTEKYLEGRELEPIFRELQKLRIKMLES